MSSIPELYAKFLYDHYNCRATWPPGLRLALGDVGFLEKGVFDRYTSLGALGVSFEKQKSSAARQQGTHVSSETVEVEFKAAGKPASWGSALLPGQAGVLIRFHDSSGFVVSFRGLSHWSIVDHRALERRILDLYRREEWDRRWVVVTQLTAAESATVLISETSGGEVELSAGASFNSGLGGLGDAEAGLAIVRSQGLAAEVIAEGSLTPMFRGRQLRRRLFRSPGFEARVESDAREDAAERVPVGDLELADIDPQAVGGQTPG